MAARARVFGRFDGCARFLALAALAATSAVSGCDDSPRPAPAPPPATQPASPASATARPAPGHITGRATNAAGKPLPGVRVDINGTTDRGERTNFRTETGPDGRYSLRVPDGVYGVRAKILTQYHGVAYLLSLHPADGRTGSRYDTRDGVTKNFVWRISGLHPDATPGATARYNYYGASVRFRDRNSYRERLGQPTGKHFSFPAGSRLTVTLTPDGPLIDGSAGKPIEQKYTFRDVDSYDYNWGGATVLDIPVGRYVLKATLTPPDGGPAKPLRVATISETETDRAKVPQPGETTIVDFKPDTSQTYAGGVHEHVVYLIAPD